MQKPAWHRVETLDLVVALALTLATQAEIWAPAAFGAEEELTQKGLLALTSLAVSLPLALRRVLPWPVAVVALGAEIVQSRLATPPEGLANLLAMLLVVYSLGRYANAPNRWAGGLLVAAASFAIGEDLADNLFVLLLMGSAWAAGVLVARRTDDLGTLELRRLEATREGAEEERLRIAGELHDVVAHRVSMMVVQSQLADALVESDVAGARAAIRAVEAAGRDALTELRSLLGLLHDGEPAARAPGETDLDRLPQLVEAARSGGLPVSLEVEGAHRPVPPAVALATFRIIQESLTNVVKHGGSAPTRVSLTYRPGVVEVSIGNDGAALEPPHPGHGMAGMAERASFVGGNLVAGPAPGGGFLVRAVLPTPEPAP